jgi:hypothetical protein
MVWHCQASRRSEDRHNRYVFNSTFNMHSLMADNNRIQRSAKNRQALIFYSSPIRTHSYLRSRCNRGWRWPGVRRQKHEARVLQVLWWNPRNLLASRLYTDVLVLAQYTAGKKMHVHMVIIFYALTCLETSPISRPSTRQTATYRLSP